LHVLSLDNLQDYCQFETFEPKCWQSEVIVIKEAYYGRRHASRCTEAEGEEFARNPRYFGCSADVTAVLHARCSGRKQCRVRIPDPELENTGACVVGLRMFLEANYYCAEGQASTSRPMYRVARCWPKIHVVILQRAELC